MLRRSAIAKSKPFPARIGQIESVQCHAALRSKGREMSRRLTAIIQREESGFVALCPELDVASQGNTIESARENLREALELFFECASPDEIHQRLGEEVFVTHVEVSIG